MFIRYLSVDLVHSIRTVDTVAPMVVFSIKNQTVIESREKKIVQAVA